MTDRSVFSHCTVASRRFFPDFSKLFKFFVDFKHKTNDKVKYWERFRTLMLLFVPVLNKNIEAGKLVFEIPVLTSRFTGQHR